MWHAKNNHPDYRIKQKFGLGWQDERTLLGTILNGTESIRVMTDRVHCHLILEKNEELLVFHHHPPHPLTTGANGTFMEIPSQPTVHHHHTQIPHIKSCVTIHSAHWALEDERWDHSFICSIAMTSKLETLFTWRHEPMLVHKSKIICLIWEKTLVVQPASL